ncbi:S-layer homology domain-containing protein [Paenibacillus polymyxa]|uniref:S-layer homology domain-containing protein n=1 Tax=Paenibacillus polymyxa TaxID=1406 RepID=UPI00042EA2AA|nr:S-layer homology domain-containing protein [Paenibacillus polymyxa]AHM64129.1 peptidase s8 and s53 subtilisin kexin sedolisin [Paenibacillus polymyxa SQR-21]MEE4581194.1 S-layer homology domain-containing protein [Paenibacillus polymyxa]
MKLVNRNKWIASAMVLGIASGSIVSLPWMGGAQTAYAATADTQSETGFVAQARTLGLMTGGNQGDFMAQKNLTRAEAAKILCSLFQLEVNNKSQTSFMDVSSDAWGAPYIEAVRAAGYMTGNGELFRPGDAITKEELIVSLVRAMDLQDAGNADAQQNAVQVARNYGLLSEDASTTDLKNPLNRESGAEVFVSLLDHPVGEVKSEGNTVRIGNIPYQLEGSLQGLFGENNKAVLKGAKIDLNRNLRTLTGVNKLEINADGGVFDGKGVSFDGRLIVNGSVTLKNMSSTGVLEIKGSGTQPVSAILENTTWSGVELGSQDAQLTATGTTKIDNLTLKNDASIVTEGNAAISRVSLQQGLGKLLVNGSIGLLDASQYVGVPFITLAKGAAISQLNLPEQKQPQDVIINYNAMKEAVSLVNGTTKSSSTGAVVTDTDSKDKKKHNSDIISVDRSRLETEVHAAKELLERAGEGGTDQALYPAGAKENLSIAIHQAMLVLNNTAATQVEVDQALSTLKQDVSVYTASATEPVIGTQELIRLIQLASTTLEQNRMIGDEFPPLWDDSLSQAIRFGNNVLEGNAPQNIVDREVESLGRVIKVYKVSVKLRDAYLHFLDVTDRVENLKTDKARYKSIVREGSKVYLNPLSTTEQLEEWTQKIEGATESFLALQAADFSVLKNTLQEAQVIYDQSGSQNTELDNLIQEYTEKMHTAMTQLDVLNLNMELSQRLTEFTAPVPATTREKLQQLVQDVQLKLLSDPVARNYLNTEMQLLDQQTMQAHFALIMPFTPEEQLVISYNQLSQAKGTYIEKYNEKRLQLRDKVIEMQTAINGILMQNSGALSAEAQQALSSASEHASIFLGLPNFELQDVVPVYEELQQVQSQYTAPIAVDTMLLNYNINLASNEVLTYGRHYTEQDNEELQGQINLANLVLNNPDSTQLQVDQANTDLITAFVDYQSKWIVTDLDINEIKNIANNLLTVNGTDPTTVYFHRVVDAFNRLDPYYPMPEVKKNYMNLEDAIQEYKDFIDSQQQSSGGATPPSDSSGTGSGDSSGGATPPSDNSGTGSDDSNGRATPPSDSSGTGSGENSDGATPPSDNGGTGSGESSDGATPPSDNGGTGSDDSSGGATPPSDGSGTGSSDSSGGATPPSDSTGTGSGDGSGSIPGGGNDDGLIP